MEALLLGGDSSDDDSDNEQTKQQQQQPPNPVVAPASTTTGPPPPNASPADVSERLRNLYKAPAAAAPRPAPAQQQQPPLQSQSHSAFRSVPSRPSTSSSSTKSLSSPPQQQAMNPPPRVHSKDPYAPNPVSKMMDHHGGQRLPPPHSSRGTSGGSTGNSNSSQPPPQQSPLQQKSHHPSSTTTTTTNTSTSIMSQDQIRRLKREKETFLMFTKVLMRYLEQKDRPVHKQVQAVIRECAERNKRGEPGYESVTISMRSRLKQVVSEAHWKKAETFFHHFLKQRQQQGGSGTSSSTPSSSSQQQQSQPPPQQQQQQQKQQSSSTSSGSSGSSSNRKLSAEQTKALEQKRAAALYKQRQQQQPQQQAASNSQNTQASQQPLSQSSAASSQQSSVTGTSKGVAGDAATGGASPAGSKAATKKSSTKSGKGSGSKSTSGKAKTTKTTKRQSSSASQSGSTSLQRRTSGGSTSATTKQSSKASDKSTPVLDEAANADLIKEYEEFMELVDHSMNLDDWLSSILVSKQKSKATLSAEQQEFLFRDPDSSPNPPETKDPEDTTNDTQQTHVVFPKPGWAGQNVISARSAWAKIRLRERGLVKEQQMNGGQPISGSVLTAPSSSGGERTIPVTSWFNDDVAERDETLALISEATQIFLKDVLQKAVHCARQRENFDGLKLWHQHVAKRKGEEKKPPLSLRLGCNVRRQVMQAQGNAAMTVKRMESALEHQTNLPTSSRMLNEETLLELESIEHAAIRPRLGNAVENADRDAKRSFEIYGGKEESTEPPLGRAAKKAMLEVTDFQTSMSLPSGHMRKHKTFATGAFFSF